MIPWEKLDTARIPGTDDELRLMRRGKEFSIMLGTNELMNSRLSGSEAALATLAAKKIEKVAKPHMLIGGLGMLASLLQSTPDAGSDCIPCPCDEGANAPKQAATTTASASGFMAARTGRGFRA